VIKIVEIVVGILAGLASIVTIYKVIKKCK
jgi:hypothetical protein